MSADMLEDLLPLVPLDALKIALVLALAFFIGLEREEHKQREAPYGFGGVRTFPLIGLVSYALALMSAPALAPWALGFAVVGGFMLLSYHQQARGRAARGPDHRDLRARHLRRRGAGPARALLDRRRPSACSRAPPRAEEGPRGPHPLRRLERDHHGREVPGPPRRHPADRPRSGAHALSPQPVQDLARRGGRERGLLRQLRAAAAPQGSRRRDALRDPRGRLLLDGDDGRARAAGQGGAAAEPVRREHPDRLRRDVRAAGGAARALQPRARGRARARVRGARRPRRPRRVGRLSPQRRGRGELPAPSARPGTRSSSGRPSCSPSSSSWCWC